MPYFGLSSFLPAWSYERNQTTCKFQCPTSGFLLFYLIVTYRIIFTEIKFQCPTSGFLLFYFIPEKWKGGVWSVSMPYLGLSSFLRFSNPSSPTSFKGFNALPRAFFFSTDIIERQNEIPTEMFQCPTSGFLLFYRDWGDWWDEKRELFQCPTSGFLLFYQQ